LIVWRATAAILDQRSEVMRFASVVLQSAASASFFLSQSAVAAGEPGGLFAQLDGNGDGQVTAQEAGKDHRLLYRRLVRTADENGDGRLAADEFAAGLTPVRAEKAVVQKQGSRIPGSDALLVILYKMDTSGDRQLDAKEIPADYKFIFDRMLGPGDADKNGRLDRREISQFAPQLGLAAAMGAAQLGINVSAELAKMPQSQMAEMERMDAYGRPAEMLADPAQAAEMFARFDGNGDGFVTLDEAPGPFADRLEQMLPRLDGNRDGKLSKAEFLEMARRVSAFERTPADPKAVRRIVRQMLNRFDADGDGALSVKEAPRRMAENFDRTDRDANGKLDASELEVVGQMMSRLEGRAGRRGRGGSGPPRMVDDQSDGSAKVSPSANSAGAERRGRRQKKAN
jgi:Ca2+-binding EF-hand superfamily protein